MQMDFTRQLGIADPERLAELHIDLVGCGGIGSSALVVLAKLGCRDIRVFDFDTVSDVNLPSQMFCVRDAAERRLKVLASADLCRELSGVTIVPVAAPAPPADLRGVVILAPDSMEARCDIWEGLSVPQVDRLIDVRMGGQSLTVLTVWPADPMDRMTYERSLLGAVQELPCTERAISFNTWACASLVGRAVARVAMGLPLEQRIDLDLESLSLFVA